MTFTEPTPPPARSRGVLVAVALIIAILALVVAASAVVLATLALGRSDDAVTTAKKAESRPLPAATTTTPGDPPAPDPALSASPDADGDADPAASQPADISPTAQFDVAYEGEKLRVRSVSCSYSNVTNVDLDEPRVLSAAETILEFGYAQCSPGKISTNLPFAQLPGPEATPFDCLEKIRTDPGRAPVAPTTGMTLCFVTSQDVAAAGGLSQKLVFVTVDSLTEDNDTGILGITVKAWTYPQ